ncbi:hypothetical protein R2F25_13400 [Streptomyces sp. UP1A-1]|nr:hypothetical protein [Streptomyces sp. UP1A-1]
MLELAGAVPDYHPIRNWMYGSKIGNVVYDAGNNCVALCKLYVKK